MSPLRDHRRRDSHLIAVRKTLGTGDELTNRRHRQTAPTSTLPSAANFRDHPPPPDPSLQRTGGYRRPLTTCNRLRCNSLQLSGLWSPHPDKLQTSSIRLRGWRIHRGEYRRRLLRTALQIHGWRIHCCVCMRPEASPCDPEQGPFRAADPSPEGNDPCGNRISSLTKASRRGGPPNRAPRGCCGCSRSFRSVSCRCKYPCRIRAGSKPGSARDDARSRAVKIASASFGTRDATDFGAGYEG